MPRPRCNAWQADLAPASRNVAIVLLNVTCTQTNYTSIDQPINQYINVLGRDWTQQPKDQLSEFTKTQSVSYMQSNP